MLEEACSRQKNSSEVRVFTEPRWNFPETDGSVERMAPLDGAWNEGYLQPRSARCTPPLSTELVSSPIEVVQVLAIFGGDSLDGLHGDSLTQKR
jgi:hypothetical protein